MSEQAEVGMSSDEVIESNGYIFKRTHYNGIRVIIDEETGYYNATVMCSDNRKQFRHIVTKKYWIEYIEALRRSSGSNIPDTLIIEITNVQNEFRGQYIHPELVNYLCIHIDYDYAIKVSRLMNLLNERNRLINQTLEQTIDNLNKEISDLKAKNESKSRSLDELEAELVSRAIKIDELESEIEDLTTPIDRRAAPPTAYARPIANDYFQLKSSASILGPNTVTLRRESFIGADDCVKQTKEELKKRNLLINVNGNNVIERSNLDEVFDILHRFKERVKTGIEARNEWLDREIEQLRQLPSTAQREGKIFELEYIRQHEELTPWALVPISIKNELNEMIQDTGIDAVVLSDDLSERTVASRAAVDAVVLSDDLSERTVASRAGIDDSNRLRITKIVQMKYKRLSRAQTVQARLRADELITFISKSQQPRYQYVDRLLVTKNCIVGPRIRKLLNLNKIEVVEE